MFVSIKNYSDYAKELKDNDIAVIAKFIDFFYENSDYPEDIYFLFDEIKDELERRKSNET